MEDVGLKKKKKAGAELQGYRSGMGVFEGTTAGGRLAREEREEVGKITGPPPTPSASPPAPVLSEGVQRGFEGIPAGVVRLCACGFLGGGFMHMHRFIRAEEFWHRRGESARFRWCICTSDGRADC